MDWNKVLKELKAKAIIVIDEDGSFHTKSTIPNVELIGYLESISFLYKNTLIETKEVPDTSYIG